MLAQISIYGHDILYMDKTIWECALNVGWHEVVAHDSHGGHLAYKRLLWDIPEIFAADVKAAHFKKIMSLESSSNFQY